MREPQLLKEIQLAASKAGARLFRNVVGMGWMGNCYLPQKTEMVQVRQGDVVIRHARPLHSGLPVGSGDLIGLVPVVVSQEMVGKTICAFGSVEGKTSGTRTTKQQKAWCEMVNTLGGKAVITSTVDGAIEGLGLGVKF